MKKLLSLVLSAVMMFSLAACGGEEKPPAGNGEDLESTENVGKIGILTGTVSQNEEEYRAAQAVLEKYGERVVTMTYPDKFMDEQETLISTVATLAADPDIKAIIMCQAVPGTSAAIDRIKETRDDILFIAATSGEDPGMIASRADVVLMGDEPGMGKSIAQQAKDMGAKAIVHYSFPRHMSYAQLSERRDNLKAEAETLGMEFIDETAPDPTSDAGVSGTQQFMIEDVPRKIEKYGKDTAFFATNCAMQIPLIATVLDNGGIYPQPCCPSPFHGYPSACSIEVPEENAGDIDYMIKETKAVIADKGGTGRFSTWPVPMNMMFVEAGAEYAIEWIDSGANQEEKFSLEKIQKHFDSYAGVDVTTRTYDEEDGTYENFVMILMDFLVY